MLSDANWNLPLVWNRKAEREGRRISVFCGSMCDVFEDRPELVEPRRRLFHLVASTENLDWLLLTKRSERAAFLIKSCPPLYHVWFGMTAENQTMFDFRESRRPHVEKLFLSMEPLLEPVDLGFRIHDYSGVIVGGETGPGARPMHPAWVRSIRDQCAEAKVLFFFKGWGEWMENGPYDPIAQMKHKRWGRLMPNGNWYEYPKKSTCEIAPLEHSAKKSGSVCLICAGKQLAGRLLDGREHNDLPWVVKGGRTTWQKY